MLRLLARSGAAVVIVGALVFAVPVAAQADVWDTAWFELSAVAAEGGAIGGVIGEGVVAAAPEVASGFACAASLPVCAAVGGAVIGATLYLTKDTWIPWFTNGATVPTGSQFGPSAQNFVANLYGAGAVGFTGAANQAPYASVWWGGSPAANYGFYFTQVDWTTADGRTETWTGSTGGAQTLGGGRGFTNYNPWNPTAFYNSTFTASGWHITGITAHVGDLAIQWGQTATPVVASLQVSCTNPDGSQYSVTSAVPSANGMVEMPTCTGATGDLGGAKAKCATLSAGTSLPTAVVESSNCVAAGTAGLLYPECIAAGCIYRVAVDGVACTVGRPGCSDWAAVYATSPGRVMCRYGEHAVSVDHCFFLERVYENGLPVPATLGNTDGNPATFTGTAPLPNPGSQPQPQPQPIPNGAPGGDPGTLPGGSTGALPSPSGVPSTNGDCFGGGTFSWNPIDWVVTPVKCALAWAFVPSPAALANFSNGVGTGFAGTSLGRWSASLGGLVPAITGTGCAGPSLSTGFMSGLPGHPIASEIHPFDACSAPMSTVAATSYMILSAGIAFYGGMKVVRQLGYAFGFQIHAGSERSTFT